MIVPGTARLAFTITVNSSDANRSVVRNLGRAIAKKITVKISGNEVMSLSDSDVYLCYCDLWLSKNERRNSAYQGIGNENMLKLRVGAADGDKTNAKDAAVADAFGNRFHLPLDFELLESHMPFYQSALGDRLEYEITFNDYSQVLSSTGDDKTTYDIDNISLEFDMVTDTTLAARIRNQFNGPLVILYDRVLRHRKIVKNRSDTVWNINLNTPARSMKGILMLFERPAEKWTRNPEHFYNPKITNVEVTIEGVPNQLYSQGMRAYQQWGEARKFFAGTAGTGAKRHPEVAMVVKDVGLADVSLEEFLTTKYALWLDMRSTDDDRLHGTGRRVENASEGITLQISKKSERAGELNIYVYLLMDAQLNLENGRFVSAMF